MDLAMLQAELFEPRIGSGFRLCDPEGASIEATLLRCARHPRTTMPGAAREAFSLILAAPTDSMPHFNSGAFTVHHAEMAPFGPVHVERIHSSTPATALLEIAFN